MAPTQPDHGSEERGGGEEGKRAHARGGVVLGVGIRARDPLQSFAGAASRHRSGSPPGKKAEGQGHTAHTTHTIRSSPHLTV